MNRGFLEIPDGLRADRRLAGQKPKDAVPSEICVPVADLRPRLDEAYGIDTQLAYGEEFYVWQERNDWVFGSASQDFYRGWVKKDHLRKKVSPPTHKVMARGTFIYPEADLKSPALMKIPLGSKLSVMGEAQTRGTPYFQVPDGFVVQAHLCGLEDYAKDFVAVAESLLGTAYLWGGRTSFGIDCSGFIQLSCQMAGISILRDSDMQEQTIGKAIPLKPDLSGLVRGDLLYWPGHCAIMTDETRLIHANGHTMTVASEPVAEAVERISYLYQKPRSARRLPSS